MPNPENQVEQQQAETSEQTTLSLEKLNQEQLSLLKSSIAKKYAQQQVNKMKEEVGIPKLKELAKKLTFRNNDKEDDAQKQDDDSVLDEFLVNRILAFVEPRETLFSKLFGGMGDVVRTTFLGKVFSTLGVTVSDMKTFRSNLEDIENGKKEAVLKALSMNETDLSALQQEVLKQHPDTKQQSDNQQQEV